MNRRTTTAGVSALLAALMLVSTGCTSEEPPVRANAGAGQAPLPAGAGEVTEQLDEPAAETCDDPTASLRPQGDVPGPGNLPSGSTMAQIRNRGTLVVGVDQNTYNFGYRNPFNGQVEGFDVDLGREIANAIFGDPDQITRKVLTSDQRIPALQNGDVDIVIRTMTITCERKEKVDFSTVYYNAGQRLLVEENAGIESFDDLGDRRVCATEGSTSLARIANHESGPVPVAAADWTDCLVMLQQNQVDAISTDDTILAGFAAQDPFTTVLPESDEPPLAEEPYGIAVKDGQEDLVRFVNGVLDQLRDDGTWTDLYDKWVADLLPGPTPSPPAPRYED